MRYVLGPTFRDDDDERLSVLIRMFVMARILRGEPIFGVKRGSDIGGVALVSYPDGPPSPAEFTQIREEVWTTLGAQARDRYEAFGRACKPLLTDVPRIHLNMIGVRPDNQGLGLSRRLLHEVHRHARETPGARGVSLTTEDPANLTLYEYFGYEVIGHARVDAELETWGLFRPN